VTTLTRSEGRFGSLRVFEPEGAAAGLVFLFSDVTGFSPGLEQAALRAAGDGALVVGVDLKLYLAGLRASDDGCHYVVAEIEDLSHRLEREQHFARYRSPILAGIGEGGTLAYAALAQSPAATVAGALSVDPAPRLETRVPLCEGAPSHPDPAGGFGYGARPALPGFWWVSPRDGLPADLAPLASEPSGAPPGRTPEDRLVFLIEAALEQAAAPRSDLADLPLVELPVAGHPKQLAVVYSGDGGWRDIDKQIAGVLAHSGTPTVGVDSLRYFWWEKSPELVASDLARILRHYTEQWGTNRVLLVGYSFGAGILPFAVNRLPDALRADVVQISLLGLEPRAPFQISVSGWVGDSDRGLPVLPELVQLDLARLQCFYGEAEKDTLCTAPELARAEIVRTRGGHHFDGDYEGLARRILDGAARREGR